MTDPRRLPGHLASLMGGVLAGALIALLLVTVLTDAVGGTTEDEPSRSERPAATDPGAATDAPSDAAATETEAETLLLAWASGGLPRGTETMLRRSPQVRRVTTVVAGIDWLEATRSRDGSFVRTQPKGLAVPLDVAVIDPTRYAAFAPPAERATILALEEGEALMAETEAELRSLQGDGTLQLVDRQVAVVGTVSDVAANGYELLLAGRRPESWPRSHRFALFHLRSPAARSAIERRLDRLLDPGQRFRVRAKGETPFLRYGDAVLPQMLIKEAFGEFAARPSSDGSIAVDPAWRAKNIVTVTVPILGSVTCHRAVIPQLRSALRQVVQEGLGSTINQAQYGGCYGPRTIGSIPGGRLSHHTWGIAIDINVAENAFGTKADQDPRLVQIFESHGFTWGGRWLIPDGMHFEWVTFP